MANKQGELEAPLVHADFVEGLAEEIRQINRSTGSQQIPELDREKVQQLATNVAALLIKLRHPLTAGENSMANKQGEFDAPLVHADFVEGLAEEIREINRSTVSQHIPELDREKVLKLAASVAELRARYLESALLRLHLQDGQAPDDARVREVSERRHMYEEAVHAFDALTRAIARGYVDMPELPQS